MEYRLEHKGLKGFENIRFAVDLVKLTKSNKNRSFPNLTDCCKVPIKQKKLCPDCGNEVTTTPTHKMFKLGKESYPISAQHLTEIKDRLDDDKIVITEFRDKGEVPDLFYTDVLFASKQHKKYMREYNEYSAVLSSANKIAIGTFIHRNRPYPIIITAYRNCLIVRALHFHEEVDTVPTTEPTTVNTSKVDLLVKVMALNKQKNPFDITQFVNLRAQQEEELVEKVIKGEALPEIQETSLEQPNTVEDDEEVARLQQLLLEVTT